jgi:hypothetical protein
MVKLAAYELEGKNKRKMEQSKIILDISLCSFTVLPSGQSVLHLSTINMLHVITDTPGKGFSFFRTGVGTLLRRTAL